MLNYCSIFLSDSFEKKFASIFSILSFSLVLSKEVYSSNMKTNLFGEWKCNYITKIEDGIIY